MKQPAILLIGPTGSGKTPLGEFFENNGAGDSQYLHFDFGENLRRVSLSTPNEVVSQSDVDLLKRLLERGALLEDEHFPIAKRILTSFLKCRGATPSTIVIMNGLPRHVGQAEALEDILRVQEVIVLQCSASVVLSRIASNTGGDRQGRVDDDQSAVQRKLEVFAQRTAPLVEYYQRRGVTITQLNVSKSMTPAQMWNQLEKFG